MVASSRDSSRLFRGGKGGGASSAVVGDSAFSEEAEGASADTRGTNIPLPAACCMRVRLPLDARLDCSVEPLADPLADPETDAEPEPEADAEAETELGVEDGLTGVFRPDPSGFVTSLLAEAVDSTGGAPDLDG